MSITDTTSYVTTSWTEQSVVQFSAGTLASVSEMVTEVESKLKRGTLTTTTAPSTTEVERWLVRAKQELVEIKRFTWRRRYAYADTVAGTYRYGLPPDYAGGIVSLINTTSDAKIEVWPEDWMNDQYPDISAEASNEPSLATIKGSELWIVPPPDGVYRLELEYDRSGDDNTATDFSWLPEIERFRCCDYAVYQAFISLHQWEAASAYKGQWQEDVMKARNADGKKRWARTGYQARSLFQTWKH